MPPTVMMVYMPGLYLTHAVWTFPGHIWVNLQQTAATRINSEPFKSCQIKMLTFYIKLLKAILKWLALAENDW